MPALLRQHARPIQRETIQYVKQLMSYYTSIMMKRRSKIFYCTNNIKQQASTQITSSVEIHDIYTHNKCLQLILGHIAANRPRYSICKQTEQHGLFVCPLVTFVSPAKTAEPIEMPSGADSGRPQNHIYQMRSRSTHEKGQFWGLSSPLKSNVRRTICRPRARTSYGQPTYQI